MLWGEGETAAAYNKVSLTVIYIRPQTRHAGSDGRMSGSISAGPGFDPQQDGKFSFENFQPRG